MIKSILNFFFGSTKKQENIVERKPLKNPFFGDEVLLLKRRLNAHGASLDELNDYFGPATEEAVKDFQKISSLNPNGIVDEKTWDALNLGIAPEKPKEYSKIKTPPWMIEARKHLGKTEFMAPFVSFLEKF